MTDASAAWLPQRGWGGPQLLASTSTYAHDMHTCRLADVESWSGAAPGSFTGEHSVHTHVHIYTYPAPS